MTDAVSAVANILYENWSLQNPSKTDIYWAKTRVEAVDFAKIGKNYVVACYPVASSTRAVAAGVWRVEENIAVDIFVRVTGSVQDAVETRENMRGEVYRILQEKEIVVEGFGRVYVSREINKAETFELARLTLQVVCVYLRVKQP